MYNHFELKCCKYLIWIIVIYSNFTAFRKFTHKVFMTKFPKLRTLTGAQKSKKFFGEHTFPTRFFDPYWPPELCPTRENAKIKKFFFSKRNFFIYCSFFPFSNSTRAVWIWALQKNIAHVSPIMVSLASSTLTVPILIPKWGQNTTKYSQELHISQYSHIYNSFLALFLHFSSIVCFKWIF